jgi:hypothetical protein
MNLSGRRVHPRRLYLQRLWGWVEPGHTLEFDDYTVVLRGALIMERGDNG